MMTVEDATTRLRMLLLLVAATLLATLAERSPPPAPLLPPGGQLHFYHNLNSVLDLASRINRSLAAVSTTTTVTVISRLLRQMFESFQSVSPCVWLQETFVEDVSHLAEGVGKCEVRRT